MNDRFKFRAWDIGVQEMIYFDFDNIDYAVDTTLIKEYIKEGNLMQCTGKKDKNGTLIYEGDWVDSGQTSGSSNTALRNRTKICGQVFNKDGLYYFGNPKSKYNRWLLNHLQLEIIGNVKENPELMEGNDE